MEQAVSFEHEGSVLRGILHRPDASSGDVAAVVVFLHGWSGCRLGPHRMFVKTARRLCERGIACLRFDFRGRGESDGAQGDATIQTMISDAGRAVAWVCDELGVEEVVLLGICSGGKVAIGTAARGAPVGGLALWSAEAMGPLRAASTDARKTLSVLRDYAGKLMAPDTWRRLLKGQINVRIVRKAVLGHEGPDRDERAQESALLERFRSYARPVLFVYGGRDPATALAAAGYAHFCADARIEHEMHEIDDANHSFYSLTAEQRVIELTESWLARCQASGVLAPIANRMPSAHIVPSEINRKTSADPGSAQ